MIEPNILLATLTALILSVAVYLLGYFINCFDTCDGHNKCQRTEFESFFKRITLGTLVMTLLYATLRSGGVAIIIGAAVPLFIGVFNTLHRKGSANLKFKLRPFLPSLPVAVCYVLAVVALVAINYLHTASPTGEVFDINIDYAFYASVANNLSQTGVETLNPDFANPELIAPMLYRYGELWLTALVGQSGVMSLYYTLLLVVFPFLGAVALVGMGALCEQCVGISGWKTTLAVACVALLTIVSFKMLLYEGGLTQVTPIKYTSLLVQRFYPILIALIFAFLVDGWRKIAVVCMAGFLSPTAIAPVLAGTTLYLGVAFFGAKHRDRNFWLSVAVVVGTALYFFGFYTLSAVPNPYLKESYSLLYAFQLAMWQFGWVSLLQYAALPLMDIAVNIAPYVLLLLLLKREKRNELLVIARENSFLIYILAASVFGFTSIWYVRDSLQIYYSVAYPLFTVVKGLVITFVLFKGGTVARSVALFLLVLNVVFVGPTSEKKKELNEKFYSEIATVLSADTTEHRFAWVDFKEVLSMPDLYMRDAAYRKPLHNISRFDNGYTPIRLDVFNIEYDPADVGDRQTISSIENSSFYRYVSKHKLQKNLTEAQNRYIREHKIRYVIVPRGLNWFEGRGFNIERVIESPSENYSFYVLEL